MLSTLKVFQNSDTSVDTENALQNSVNCNLEQIWPFKFDLNCQKVNRQLKKTGKVNIPQIIKEPVTVDFQILGFSSL